MRKYYVYAHYKQDTRELFYIGKGTGHRCTSTHNRSTAWKDVVAIHGFISKILFDNLTSDSALLIEAEQIELHKDFLVNKNKPKTRIVHSFDEIFDMFRVDPSSPSGLVWKRNRVDSMGRLRKYANRPAGSKGWRYWVVEYKNQSIPVHRLIWLLNNPEFDQELDIDHINGDSFDNRIENLRQVTKSVNARNRILPSRTGLTYIYLSKRKHANPHYLLKVPNGGVRKEYYFYFKTEQEKSRALAECLSKREELFNELERIGVTKRVLENAK